MMAEEWVKIGSHAMRSPRFEQFERPTQTEAERERYGDTMTETKEIGAYWLCTKGQLDRDVPRQVFMVWFPAGVE